MSEKALDFHFVAEQSRCSMCNGYLSCKPIRVLPNGNCICGRCVPLENDLMVYRVLPLENILSKVSFPCRFKEFGCTQNILFDQVVGHELKCAYQPTICPSLPSKTCSWKEALSKLLDHILRNHPDFINDDVQFKLQLNENAQGTSISIKNNIMFTVRYSYDAQEKYLKYDIRYCTSETVAYDIFSKMQLINGTDKDCSINVKPTKCRPYDSSFLNTQNAIVLNLMKYLPSLENPTCIFVGIDLKREETTSAANVYLTESLKCPTCRNYLTPSLFDKNGITICIFCAKSYPTCVPTKNIKLQNIMNQANLPCRWKRCKFVGKAESYEKHEIACQLRLVDCWLPPCKKKFKLNSAEMHFQLGHQAEYLPNDGRIIYTVSLVQSGSAKCVFTKRNGIIIAIIHSYDGFTSDIHNIRLDSTYLGKISGNAVFKTQYWASKAITIESGKLFTANIAHPCSPRTDNIDVTIDLNIPHVADLNKL